MTDSPTPDELPIDRLRNLVDRACRHLTPQEANALRGALAGTMRNASAAIEELHKRAAEAEDDRNRARTVAVTLEQENARLEEQLKTARDGAAVREAILTEARDALEDAGAGGHGNDWPHLAPGIRALRARAERAEQQAARVRALAERWRHTGDRKGGPLRELLAALDAAGQPEVCGRTKAVSGTLYAPCDLPAGHDEAYCRNEDGTEFFLAAGQPDCRECGDTGACNGGPCAHPDAAPSR